MDEKYEVPAWYDDTPWTEPCAKHGEQEVVDVIEFSGFAGGWCSVATLACGCQVLDDSADVAAAF